LYALDSAIRSLSFFEIRPPSIAIAKLANFSTRLKLPALPLPPAPGASGGLHQALLRHYISPPFQGGHLSIIVLPLFLVLLPCI
jgi:hypothetical protein